MTEESKNELYEMFVHKASLKQDVYQNTLTTFKMLTDAIQGIEKDFHEKIKETKHPIPFEHNMRGDFEIELKFGGDTLIFMMHTNVFEIPRDHFVNKTSYVKEDKDRSYCGIINIYNFLSDSFKYNRVNDSGYLIGRIFVNKDMHYFIEGKRELGAIYNNFVTSVMDEKAIWQIVESAIKYTINFDLLTPPYDAVKLVSVYEFLSRLDSITLKTGKRLGFQFQADNGEEE